jgi:hypothetical protein
VADTRIQLQVEDWVRQNWMPNRFGTRFSRERVKLRSGGVFDFDAVNDDHTIIATISTSGARTATGNQGSGKLLKLRSDMLFLMLAEKAKRRVMVLTEPDMHEQLKNEAGAGRMPMEIEVVCAEIPAELRSKLDAARKVAVSEMTVKAAKASG